MTLSRYLAGHAESLAREAPKLTDTLGSGPWCRAVVIPAYDEDVAAVQRATEALRGQGALLIMVINEPQDASSSARLANAALADAVGAEARVESPGGIRACRWRDIDALLVERTERRGGAIPAAHGVGLARKLGIDIAAALVECGAVESSWIATTDADVELPDDYARAAVGPPRAGVASAAFWHREGETEVDQLTELYELWLRYYAEGLAWAGSPYGVPILGSAIAVEAGAYAAVRGVPKRAAGEDFYLASKLIAHHGLGVLDCKPILISARVSSRTPFGTGPAVRRWQTEGTAQFYDPRVFEVLRAALQRVEQMVVAGDNGVVEPRVPQLEAPWASLKIGPGLARALRGAPSTDARRTRARQWFDALKTLRFVHAVEASTGWRRQPWQSALRRAAFVPPRQPDSPRASRVALAQQLRTRMALLRR